MGQNYAARKPEGRSLTDARSSYPLSLSQTVPVDWHHDRPAFAGDPLMDWESQPEHPPHSTSHGLKLTLGSRKPE